MKDLVLVTVLAIVALAMVFAAQYFFRGSRNLGTPAQRTTYATLHTAIIAASGLRWVSQRERSPLDGTAATAARYSRDRDRRRRRTVGP